ncbi:MAG: insulinase family protein, partial [Calditrichaeota bacterium]
PDIPYKKFVLDNGLTLIVHEDHKVPVVAVNVWYHVGSKNEKPGKTGFAHLFEHLMFNGSEHFDDDYFQALDRLGATDRNGTTNRDRTNYFQNVPTNALDVVLWLESDRMGHLLGAITQEKLDEQRGVVQNEKRQGENQPYGKVFNTILENAYPKGHPYSWSPIGSMEDLNNATLDDVREWFKTYYGPANAVLSIAGDVNADEVYQKVVRYFGDIPSGPPINRQDVWIAKREENHRVIMQDRVPQARIYKVWNVPEIGSPEEDYLSLVADVLSSGKTSRFYKRLVYDEQIATDVAAYVFSGEIGSLFIIQATARPDVPLARVEKAVDEELERFLKEGPTEDELLRVKTDNIASFIRGIERIGGFGGKSDILAYNQVFNGDPSYYKVSLRRIKEATPAQLLSTAREWLSSGELALEVHPFPQYKTVPSDVDRSKMPEPGPPPTPDFPDIQQATLSNGLKVLLAERHAVPAVTLNLVVDAGYASDQFALPGTASLAMDMLDEGTKHRSALEISDELDRLGASLRTGSNLDMSNVWLSALTANLDASLDLYADVILNPVFPEADFERLRKQRLAQIKREKSQPFSMALRVFPKLLYGENHAYAIPFTGSGTEESVQKIQRRDLINFHKTWFHPNNATLVVVGDVKMEQLLPLLEKHFRNWQPAEVPRKNIADVPLKSGSEVYLIDRPGSIQSVIFAGHVAPPKSDPRDLAMRIMNTVLGGQFTSRINMNLREDKHWSYGARSLIVNARGPRPFIAYAGVQTDKTAESIVEFRREIEEIRGPRPVTAEELEKVKQNEILRLPGSWETMNAVNNAITDIVEFQLPLDYYEKYPQLVRSITLEEVNQIAKSILHPDKLIWVVVGDREKIEPKIQALNLGPIHYIDADGNPVSTASSQ